MRKTVKILFIIFLCIFCMTVFYACTDDGDSDDDQNPGENQNPGDNDGFVEYNLLRLVVKSNQMDDLLIDPDNMTSDEKQLYDMTIQMYGKKVHISSSKIRFTGTSLSTYSDADYILSGEKVGFTDSTLLNTFGNSTLARGKFSLVVGEASVSTVFEYVSDAFQTYSVTFDSLGGSDIQTISGVHYGEKITQPTDPERNVDIFNGWYKEQECKNPFYFNSGIITGNITLYAKWTVRYTVTFNTDGGTNMSSVI